MNILVFDTETTSLDKPFCYNVGYLVADTETKEVLKRADYVIEQCWHNLMLFQSAYYADKRQIYIGAMRSRKTQLEKWGYVMQQMIRDIKAYEITHAYAYNSPFDEKVFEYNCDWYKTANPFDNVEIHDIRAFAVNNIDDKYKLFCESNGLFTDSGNYSTTAETMYRYISGDIEFNEAHTALADSEIETEILFYFMNEVDILDNPVAPKIVERVVDKTLIVDMDGAQTEYTYRKRINRGNKIFLKSGK